MKNQGIPPDAITFVSLLKACSGLRNIGKGEEMHAEIKRAGLSRDYVVGNALVDFYMKLGIMEKSEEVFDSLLVRDVVAWGTLIAGYARTKNNYDALECLERMKFEGISPDANIFISSLKACAGIGAIEKAEEIYSEIAKETSLRENPSIGAAMIDMYAKCGSFKKAQEVLRTLSSRSPVAWTALIAGYVQHECWVEAVEIFQQMEIEGVTPDVVTWVCVLQACGNCGDIAKGSEIHAAVESKMSLDDNLVLSSNLVDMYAKCGMLVKAFQVFRKLSSPDAACWNALISGYVRYEYNEEALDCYDLMQSHGLSGNNVTFACTLKACCNLGDMARGREMHAEIARKGVLNSCELVDNAILNLYAKCSSLGKAKEVFGTLGVQSAISWNALISGLVQNECGEDALACFEEMQIKGISPDDVTFTCILKACGSVGMVEKGQIIHLEAKNKGLVESNAMVGTALIDMYAKCGVMERSQQVFDDIGARNIVSWTALIAGYVQNGCSNEALQCFNKMISAGISPNANTFVCIMKACGNSGSIEKGDEIYNQVEQNGLLQSNQIIGNASIDMYVRFGMLVKAQQVFERIPARDVVSWNSLLAGYSRWGEVSETLHHFERMRSGGVKPDSVTFLTVLNVCCHAGLLDKGQTYYEAMIKEYGIVPTVEHHTCIIDLFGRAAQLEKAVELMRTATPSHPNTEMWLTVLAACRKWSNVELARHAFQHVMQIDDKETNAYTCMYNIYTDAGMEEDAKKLGDVMKNKSCEN
jgi:pentatricopeptide repeat protein